jgi:hypothetical protein
MSTVTWDEIVRIGEVLDRASKPRSIGSTRVFINDNTYPVCQYRFLKSKSKVRSRTVKLRKILRWDKLILDGEVLMSELEGKAIMNSVTAAKLEFDKTINEGFR